MCKNSMLRAISICLLLLYTVSVSGITVSSHYCGNKLRAIHIMKDGGDFHSKICCKKDKMNGGCCKNKSFKFDIKNNYTGSGKIICQQPFNCIVPYNYIAYSFWITERITSAIVNYHAPPRVWPPVYLLNCTFLI